MSWRRLSYVVWGYSLWIPRRNGRIEQGFTQFQWQTLLSLLLGSICQYPSGLVGSAHRLPCWSLFSSKVACWGYHTRYPAEMVGLSKELPRFNGKTLLSLLLGPIYQYPSDLVGSAHRISHWSLFSSKNSLLELQSSSMFSVESSGSCSHIIQPPWRCLYADGSHWSLTQMSPELSTNCQAHTESLTIIPCSLGHHTEHPKWLKLVGIVQCWGHLLVMSHRALTSWLKRGTLSHSRFPSKTVPVVPGHHTEHARLVGLKERITPSWNSFSFDLVGFKS